MSLHNVSRVGSQHNPPTVPITDIEFDLGQLMHDLASPHPGMDHPMLIVIDCPPCA